MVFESILFPYGESKEERPPDRYPFFKDLNIDVIVAAIAEEKKEYDVKSFFYSPLRNLDAVRYRQEVMRDLEGCDLRKVIDEFCIKMRSVRRYLELADDLDFVLNKQGWHLEAVLLYCDAIEGLFEGLDRLKPGSKGLLDFKKYLDDYRHSDAFQSLFAGAKAVKKQLSDIRYCVIVQYGKFHVKRYEGETDYSSEIEETFKKFKQDTSESYLTDIPERTVVTHIDAKILEFVALLHPDVFSSLESFWSRYETFIAETIERFEREVQFYLAYLGFVSKFEEKKLEFSYPEVNSSRDIHVRDGFDLALAYTLLDTPEPVVCNDFSLKTEQRVMIVTGPNQGGKTTFARMFGQIHYFSSLGCLVPAREARVFLPDNIFTHFEREEDIRNLRGKLQDELVRIHEILGRATSNSILIMNEIFTSTSLSDAIFLSKKILGKILQMDCICVWVTFLDELTKLSSTIVSMVGMVDPTNPSIRTYRIVERPADGLAYALSIAEKHRLTYQQIRERIKG